MTSSAELPVTWAWHTWAALTPDTLYAFLRLRSAVFVVEQDCVFEEMDGADPHCEHLCGHNAAGELLVCLRLVPPGLKAPQPALGRLTVALHARRAGLARRALELGLARCAALYPGQAVFLSAQQHLETFYLGLGFTTLSAPYLEDGIWHINMLKENQVGRLYSKG
jgi:ElaA protein